MCKNKITEIYNIYLNTQNKDTLIKGITSLNKSELNKTINDCGMTIIMFAMQEKLNDVVNLLVNKKKVNLNIYDNDFNYPIHYAIWGRNFEGIELLINNKKYTNYQDALFHVIKCFKVSKDHHFVPNNDFALKTFELLINKVNIHWIDYDNKENILSKLFYLRHSTLWDKIDHIFYNLVVNKGVACDLVNKHGETLINQLVKTHPDDFGSIKNIIELLIIKSDLDATYEYPIDPIKTACNHYNYLAVDLLINNGFNYNSQKIACSIMQGISFHLAQVKYWNKLPLQKPEKAQISLTGIKLLNNFGWNNVAKIELEYIYKMFCYAQCHTYKVQEILFNILKEQTSVNLIINFMSEDLIIDDSNTCSTLSTDHQNIYFQFLSNLQHQSFTPLGWNDLCKIDNMIGCINELIMDS
ncbi:MAG: ankyrin repeat domain-containing protein [Rickettsiaceae bacterium]|nr:ankyrin repeat domain-containing protein [Rickettsiaceae bacterium]